MKRPKKPPSNPDRLKPISLHPLTPEEAISQFMKVDPKKVEERLEKKGIKRK